jgi:hypothetical protein
MIRAYVGLLGEGKTISMINDAIYHLERGRKIITNVDFMWKKGGKVFRPDFRTARDFERALFTEDNCIFLIDEASIFFPSYFWNKLSMDYIIKFAQARKYGLDIYYTSQGYNHTIKRLRDLTNVVVKCKRSHIGKFDLWIKNTWYDPEFFDIKIFNDEIEKKYILYSRRILRGRLHKLFKSYDTMYKIEMGSTITE